mgnify:CR=1 FL=1
MEHMKIPKDIKLAWYPVAIVVKDHAWMVEAMKCQKCGATLEGEPADGYWSKDDMTIYVDGSKSLAAQRYIILHEQVHAAIDAIDHYLDGWTVNDRQWRKNLKDTLCKTQKTPSTDLGTTTIT